MAIRDLFKAATWGFRQKSEPNQLFPIDPKTYRDGAFFELAGGDYWYYKWENYNSAVEAYRRCPPVPAIINRKAQAFINGKTWVLNSAGKEAKTSEDAKKITRLMKHPNALQSQKQFEAQGYIYQQLFGFNIILPIKPVGFNDNIDASSLWNIPASWIDINATQEQFKKSGGVGLQAITFTFNGVRTEIPIKDLIIIRDFSPSFDTITFPGSKLTPLALPINNIIGAYESRNTLINYRGALGILTNDPGANNQYAPIGLTKDEKEGLQKDFARYGLRNKQWKVIITSATLRWQQMGYSTKDLMLMEEVQESTKDICRGLNFPPFILGLADTTYNNMSAAEKGLYQNSTIPDAHSYYEQLTTAFGLEERNLTLDKDFSEVPVMQEDKKTLADARKSMNDAMKIEWDNGLCTLDEWRLRNGDDPLPDGRGKLYKPEYMQQYGQQQAQIDTGTGGQAGGQQGQQTASSQQQSNGQ